MDIPQPGGPAPGLGPAGGLGVDRPWGHGARAGRMGDDQAGRYDGGVRRYLTPRCLGLHVTLLVVLVAFGWLTSWQLGRALSGNSLSWAYTFEWPLFAGYACYMWWQLIHDEPTKVGRRAQRERSAVERAPGALEPGWALDGGRRKNTAIAAAAPIDEETGGRGERFVEQTPEEAAALARYNRYLAALEAADADRRGATEEIPRR